MKSQHWLPRLAVMVAFALVTATLIGVPRANAAEVTLLNVSYDPTRELYVDYNTAFANNDCVYVPADVSSWSLRASTLVS